MIVTVGPTLRGPRRRLGRLREYQPGTYPVPGWSYAPPVAPVSPGGCGCGGGCGKKRRRRLGDDGGDLGPPPIYGGDTPILPDSGTSSAGTPIVLGPPSYMPGGGPAVPAPPISSVAPTFSTYNVTPGGGQLTSQQLTELFSPSAYGNSAIPAVSPATLLAAAALPGAPAAVKQAAAAYSSANPVSSFFSGTILGLPTYLLLGGGLLALVLVAGGGRKR